MALESATTTQFTDFLTKYGYSVADNEAVLLSLSFAFMSTLAFCDEPDADRAADAQCFIAYAMDGGGFNPAAVVDSRTLIEKGLGRGAIVKKWSENEKLSGTEPVNLLRQVPMAYGLLKDSLCSGFGAFAV